MRPRPQRATQSCPRPQPPAPASPAPRPLPRRCRLSCGGPGGGGSCCRPAARAPVSGALAVVRRKMSSVLFLYRASPRFRGPARRAGHAPLICIGRRPLPADGSVPAASARKRSLSSRPAAACVCARVYACPSTHLTYGQFPARTLPTRRHQTRLRSSKRPSH